MMTMIDDEHQCNACMIVDNLLHKGLTHSHPTADPRSKSSCPVSKSWLVGCQHNPQQAAAAADQVARQRQQHGGNASEEDSTLHTTAAAAAPAVSLPSSSPGNAQHAACKDLQPHRDRGHIQQRPGVCLPRGAPAAARPHGLLGTVVPLSRHPQLQHSRGRCWCYCLCFSADR